MDKDQVEEKEVEELDPPQPIPDKMFDEAMMLLFHSKYEEDTED